MSATSTIRRWLERAGADKIKETKDGTEIVCTCPFHKWQSKGATFSFNTAKGLYTCFVPECGASGTAELFLQRAFGYSKHKAEQTVSRITFDDDIDIDSLNLVDYAERNTQKEKPRSDAITEGELGMFEFCPKYMLRRGYTKETLKRWEIGYDREARRVTFPVRSRDGTLMGISCRTIYKDVEPKYLHLGFDKGSVLYGEHFCKNVGGVLVVEGQTDTLAIDQRARKLLKKMNLGVVGVLGANVPDTQIKKLARYGKVILAFDNDEAGYAATEQVGSALTQRIPQGHLLVAHRYTQHDPGELITATDFELEQFFNTTPFIEYITSRLSNARNESSQEDSRKPQPTKQKAVHKKAIPKVWRLCSGSVPGHSRHRAVR